MGAATSFGPSSFPYTPLKLADRLAARLMQPEGGPRFDFSAPRGEPALVGPDSVSWRVFKNSVTVFIGGVAAVILELAEPSVRSGVWEHSSFRRDPLLRLQRTGLAAMITVYGARSRAEAMIRGVVRAHDRVTGTTPGGDAYRANDPRLLAWVQATAAFGFAEAYHRFARPLAPGERDAFYREGVPAARLYGALEAPRSATEWESLLASMEGSLEASPIVFEFLDIMRSTPILPGPLRLLQAPLVRAAIDLTPSRIRDRLGLGPAHGLRSGERALLQAAAKVADRVLLPSSPAVQACERLGLPADHLLRWPRPVLKDG
ncbi:oxygenase MpaB family protein [Enterovirga sp. CN4-39]|uniref:oxygenase MpaB family protein n=1 Tax=Enterovirga sp. CN4-39 TaxID=3400910 RepID=UPI003C09E61D